VKPRFPAAALNYSPQISGASRCSVIYPAQSKSSRKRSATQTAKCDHRR
jgi:hypothetical protein